MGKFPVFPSYDKKLTFSQSLIGKGQIRILPGSLGLLEHTPDDPVVDMVPERVRLRIDYSAMAVTGNW